MIGKRRIGQHSLLLASLLIALTICLPGCTGSEFQSNTNPSGTKLDNRMSTTSPKTTTSSIHPTNSTIKPTRQPRTATLISPDEKATITEMLKVIPDTLAPLSYIYYIEFTTWRKANGINNLNIYKDADGYPLEGGENRYINDVYLFQEGGNNFISYGTAPFISGMYPHSEKMLQSPIRTNNIGYGPLDVDQSIYAVSYLTNTDITRYEAIRGNFYPSAINQAASNTYYDLSSLPLVAEYDDMDIYTWDKEMKMERRFKPPAFDNLGQGRTLAVQEHEILGAIEAVNVYEMIKAKSGEANSTAINPRFQAIAGCLEKAGAASAVMSEMVLSYLNVKVTYKILNMTLGQDSIQLFENADSEAPLMGPYTAFASGLGLDEKGLFVLLVLNYDTVEMAENDGEVLKNRMAVGHNSMNFLWKEEIDASEVWVEGTSLCAKLRGNITGYWEDLLWSEPLLVRED